jgi:hypothetical protein
MSQINKVNHRKEFFRADLSEIRKQIEQMGLSSKWTMAAEAAEYRESLRIERAIQENPEMRDAWLKRQLLLDSVSNDYIDEDLDTDTPSKQKMPPKDESEDASELETV